MHLNVPWALTVIFFFLVCGIFLIPAILYILNLQKALRKCAPESRTLEPGLVWLLLIPLVNLVFHFFIVLGLAKSLGNEFRRRGMPCVDSTPGQNIGLAMCICPLCGFIPILGLLAGAAGLVLWIMYWIKVAEYSRSLDAQAYLPSSVV